ncbi:transaldolase family protein [Nocardia sp. NPDC050793]|uniref:transaldolase family protein n=1 Tax=Nocardia sp. NPDC050793 TaxID=3155159 RepID=UPI0033D399F3
MKFYLDSADLSEIRKWLATGVVRGVTTNPVILRNSGVSDIQAHLEEVLAYVGELPVSVQVSSCDPRSVREESAAFSALATNVHVKIPIIDATGSSMLPIISELAAEGVKVNVTACFTALQAIMAVTAGASYVSLFAGRLSDEGSDPAAHIAYTRTWIDDSEADAEIIVGSVRQPSSIYDIIQARPHIITVSSAVLGKCLDHSYSRRTVAEFEGAALEGSFG